MSFVVVHIGMSLVTLMELMFMFTTTILPFFIIFIALSSVSTICQLLPFLTCNRLAPRPTSDICLIVQGFFAL